ncbi:TRAP transporter fused permease subunit [Gammaproteobacteria bacterium AS21]
MTRESINPVIVFCAGISAVHLWLNIFSLASLQALTMAHFAALSLMTLVYPKMPKSILQWVWKILTSVLPAVAAMFLLVRQDDFHARGMQFETLELLSVFVVIIASIEFARRSGFFIAVIIVTFMSYALFWGQFIDGPLGFPGLSLETVLFRSVYTDEGMFGSIAGISASFVFMFVLFGAFLVRSGAGDFIVDVAHLVAGRVTGGPGLVAVGASALTGTVSGSAVANTVTTGVVTIPLMKRSGFSPAFAAAVEASASTGGQLMPPVMGAGAFLIASYTQSPYGLIVGLSIIPALLFFFAIALNVRIEAKRLNLKIPEDQINEQGNIWDIVRRRGASFIIAIAGLIGLLVAGFTPIYAAGIGILLIIAASWLTESPMGMRDILFAMSDGAKNATMTGLLLVAIGLVVNIIAMTGLGAIFSLFVVEWAGGNLLIALALIAIASLVLGMGLPVTAAYVVLATLCAPALAQIVGIDSLIDNLAAGNIEEGRRGILLLLDPALSGFNNGVAAARDFVSHLPIESRALLVEQLVDPALLAGFVVASHLAIFWLSQDSNVTPPVCLTAYAAAAIADSHPLKTGLLAWKISKPIYLMPIAFFTTPILSGDPITMMWGGIISLMSLIAFIVALEGYLEWPVHLVLRVALGIAGAICLIEQDIIWRVGSLVLIIIIIFAVIPIIARMKTIPATYSKKGN